MKSRIMSYFAIMLVLCGSQSFAAVTHTYNGHTVEVTDGYALRNGSTLENAYLKFTHSNGAVLEVDMYKISSTVV